ncbi:hypothetical protein [Jatrophihabitans endophyticus]|nr:hypothetical protein [Jatrophihabitans endophyticus]
MNPHPELVDGVDVDAVAAAVRGCAGVADLAEGPAGSVVSYLPGRRVAGVHVAADHVVAQVRLEWGATVPDVAGRIRVAVAPAVGARRVDVVVADVDSPPGWDDETPDAPDDRSTGRNEASTWTTAPGAAHAAPSSASTTPTGAEIRPPS